MSSLQRSGGNRMLRTATVSVKFFQRFAIGCCRVIKVFDKAKVVAMF